MKGVDKAPVISKICVEKKDQFDTDFPTRSYLLFFTARSTMAFRRLLEIRNASPVSKEGNLKVSGMVGFSGREWSKHRFD